MFTSNYHQSVCLFLVLLALCTGISTSMGSNENQNSNEIRADYKFKNKGNALFNSRNDIDLNMINLERLEQIQVPHFHKSDGFDTKKKVNHDFGVHHEKDVDGSRKSRQNLMTTYKIVLKCLAKGGIWNGFTDECVRFKLQKIDLQEQNDEYKVERQQQVFKNLKTNGRESALNNVRSRRDLIRGKRCVVHCAA
eukprot:Awhi_evm1s1537